ncbi:hypothetical protein [Brevibacillus aydinogluensis]|uniref:Metallo-beta-lactamase domain-containing protein n=1 Tax=Brevibacillus aydinogluensis TaxID=927786 RepID=A0AA48M7Q8_9BACL|nr:hypothetical protein [Brevibacillus aydinogluensis]CAJ1002802.1 hypothetical protein BSPP4475_10785 [Brevibacillus aydinogluensis]
MLGITRKACWLLLCVVLFAGCSIDSHLQNAVKVEDPYASDDEREFVGLVIHFLALPHGESTLIRLPSGKTMLVDTGSAEDWPVLFGLLSEQKLTRLDYVVVTNDQPEQAGGFAFLSDRLLVDTVILPRLIEPSIRGFVPLKGDKKLLPVADGDAIETGQRRGVGRASSQRTAVFVSAGQFPGIPAATRPASLSLRQRHQ